MILSTDNFNTFSTMRISEQLNLSDYITESLCVNSAVSPELRPFRNIITDPYKEFFLRDPLDVLGELSFGEPQKDVEDSPGTLIQEFFRGLNVLVTGGTGYFGKVLTEKLVRSIPQIGQVFLLIRPKRGKTCDERFDSLFQDKFFSRMKTEVPHYKQKISVLHGDITQPDLGLSGEDYQLVLDKVRVILHCAANVKFTEPLRNSLTTNLIGTKRVVDLAKQIPDLKSMVHVSTAYSQCISGVIEEAIPKVKVSYREVLKTVDNLTDGEIEHSLQKLLHGWPNGYTFSKALCEDMLQEEARCLPICVFRPTVVLGTYKEPVRGWTDNLYGPMGLIVGTSLGILHSVWCDRKYSMDMVPVDMVVNTIIATAWKTGTVSVPDVITVYNFSSNLQNMACWKKVIQLGDVPKTVWPYSSSIWYQSIMFIDNYYLEQVIQFFVNEIPAAVLDKMAVIIGQKPRLGKIIRTVQSIKVPVRFFMVRFWEFKNENVIKLWNDMSEEDQAIFNFDVRDIDWNEYVAVICLGIRYYFLKESMDTIPKARKKQKWLHIAHRALQVMFGIAALKLAVCIAHALPF